MTSWKRPLLLILALFLLLLALQQLFHAGSSHPMEGLPAPPFQLTTLDGQPIDLAQQLGKNVLLLDFWATWCPPCRKGLPVIDRLAKEFQDRGVAVYGVNSESPGLVKEFLKKQGLSLAVLTDPSKKVFEQYNVRGIPQTVLIGKDGIIRNVHVGLSFNFEGSLRQRIQAALKENPQ